MDPTAFDALARSFHAAGSRRWLLRRLVASLSLLGVLAVVGEEEVGAERPLHRIQRRTQQRNRKQRNRKQRNNNNNNGNNNNNNAGGGGGGDLGAGAPCDVCPSGCQFATLGTAIADAPAGATIRLCPRTYNERNVTIPRGTTISIQGAGQSSTFLTAAGFANSSVLRVEGGSLFLSDVTVSGGKNAFGAGIHIFDGGTANLDSVRVTDNIADSTGTSDQSHGGGILVSGGQLVLNNSHVNGNASRGNGAGQSGFGGGIAVNSTAAGQSGLVTVTGTSVINGNTADFGGGISLLRSTLVLQDNAQVMDNTATVGTSGGIGNDAGVIAISGNAVVTGNQPANCQQDNGGTGCP